MNDYDSESTDAKVKRSVEKIKKSSRSLLRNSVAGGAAHEVAAGSKSVGDSVESLSKKIKGLF